jgi:CDGSH-type Zn-finger protein
MVSGSSGKKLLCDGSHRAIQDEELRKKREAGD